MLQYQIWVKKYKEISASFECNETCVIWRGYVVRYVLEHQKDAPYIFTFKKLVYCFFLAYSMYKIIDVHQLNNHLSDNLKL